MLARTGLGDYSLLAHAHGEQRLADGVVELVGPRVAEILAFQVDVRSAEVVAQARRRVERRGPADESVAVSGELELELRVGLGLVPDVLQLLERAHQRLGDVLAAEGAKAAAHRMVHRDCSAIRTALMNRRIFSGSLTLSRDSTPLETSTP